MDIIAALDDGVPLHSTTFAALLGTPDKIPQVEDVRTMLSMSSPMGASNVSQVRQVHDQGGDAFLCHNDGVVFFDKLWVSDKI